MLLIVLGTGRKGVSLQSYQTHMAKTLTSLSLHHYIFSYYLSFILNPET